MLMGSWAARGMPVWDVRGLAMNCPWNVRGLPTGCPWDAHELPTDCPWDAHGLGWGRAARGLPVGCPWEARGMPMGCPWDAHCTVSNPTLIKQIVYISRRRVSQALSQLLL